MVRIPSAAKVRGLFKPGQKLPATPETVRQVASVHAGALPPAAVPAPAGAGQPAPAGTEAASAAAKALSSQLAADYQQALTLAAMGLHEAALETLLEVTARAPRQTGAWRKLAELRRLAGQDREAAEADAAADRAAGHAAAWPKPVDARTPAQFEQAEARLRDMLGEAPPREQMTRLREILFRNPNAVAAMRLLAQLELRDEQQGTAFCLLERVLDLAPGYSAARKDFAQLLMNQPSYARALAETTRLIADAPHDTPYLALHAMALRAVGRLPEAIDAMQRLVADNPHNAVFRCGYAQALHYAGRRDDSVKAYRACLDEAPETAEAYLGLAELRGNFLTDADMAAMRACLARDDLTQAGRMMMLYALANGLEGARDFAGSFAAYAAGAALFRDMAADSGYAYDAAETAERVQRRRAVFSAANLAARAAPAPARGSLPTPIFVVGMPRAGSTLVEQILGSHSLVEPTSELPVIGEITRDLMQSRAMVTPDAYPECVLDLAPHALAALGARYTELAGAYRTTKLPYFVDKRPWNWLDVGLIQLILPHAKIIDVRRAPMAACFAMFKQILPIDAAFSYDLAELGDYYKQYVGMMLHYQTVLPGRVHYLAYERLVEDTETEIRRLLEYCELPFEESCLRYWETGRAVATPSAAQVRRPIFRDALQQWRNYEPFLAPLKAALGYSDG